MRISADVTGFYDWAPCPSDVEITPADISAMRVKQMSDEKWHMRVERLADTHHDVGIPEETICRRMAALEKLGREPSREVVVSEILRESFRHHIHQRHIAKIVLQDDGPNEAMYAEALSAIGVDGDHASLAMARYTEEMDLEPYLNTVFKAKAPRKASKKVEEPK